MVAAGYLLIGLGHHELQVVLASGYSNLLVLRVLAEFGVIGISAIWVAALIAVHRERSIYGLLPASSSRQSSPPSDLLSQPWLHP